ncbi:hypothetical protein SLEP1_g49602 [Rubroshorea leprosula]|uniref:WRKY domain-containing protein n=1 Tax=Rubroshorea leprosula TaxID=152421 RepID=A0AAV5LY52_9ROSI|nr:hypothetical protein SLEP1_g49602 [Rubroshorea leprosula]
MENHSLPFLHPSLPNHEIQTNSHGDEGKRKKLEAEYQCLGAKNISEDRDGKVKSTGKKLEEHNESRKQKFAFQTRSRVDILDDGYRWRKYGQKTVKDSTFPRSYYRCTHKGCNVKKQIQRNSKDEEVVVTTYEGTHTHPAEEFAAHQNFEIILRQMQP